MGINNTGLVETIRNKVRNEGFWSGEGRYEPSIELDNYFPGAVVIDFFKFANIAWKTECQLIVAEN